MADEPATIEPINKEVTTFGFLGAFFGLVLTGIAISVVLLTEYFISLGL